MNNTCADILLTNPVTLKPQATLLEALDTIREIGVRYVPVVDEDNNFVGLFSSLTLLTLLLPSSMSINIGNRMTDLNFMTTNIEELREKLALRQDEPITEHIITDQITTLLPSSSIMEAIHVIHEKHAHVIVLQPNSRQFVGIITINGLLDLIEPKS